MDTRLFFIGLVTILLLDAIYLSLTIPTFYKSRMAEVIRPKMEPSHQIAGVFAWPVIVISLMIFVLPRARNSEEAFKFGAMFGASSYLIYNLTNYATIKVPASLGVVDTLWGSLLAGITAKIMFDSK